MVNLSSRVALVTASSKGIGFGVAKSLAQAGARLCICSRDKGAITQAKKALEEAAGTAVLALDGDIGELPFLQSLVRQARDTFGGSIDILVNNSGGPPAGDTLSMSEEQWLGAIHRNLLSVVRLSVLVVPDMKQKRWGRIINLTSMTAKEPDEGMVLSNVTRAGVAAYSKTMARELGPFGITVNTILTGGCLTDRFYSLVQKSIQGTDQSLDDAVTQLTNSIPVRYLPTPEEFAHTILFLASEEAGYLTGAAIPLDGGASRSIF